MGYLIWGLVAIFVIFRISYRIMKNKRPVADRPVKMKPLGPTQKKFYTVWMFFIISIKRLFRDRLALFFTFLFPLILLIIFGGIFGKHQSTSFNVAVINESHSSFAHTFEQQLENSKLFKVDKQADNFTQANEKMARGALDATIELPPSFGEVKGDVPTGQSIVHFTENNSTAAQTITSVLQAEFQGINSKFVKTTTPFTVVSKQNNERSLSQFDYTFTGLLGFAILGASIFGPMNVFPELKKMGILRRLHTTPLRVWQYFMANMFSNATSGLMSIAVMFLVAIVVFHLKVVGNYLELIIFLALGIITMLGIGLAIGGWAKNERQAAPLGNIVVLPMMFLTGVFFPRFLMPEWLQNITAYMPLTPVIDGARLIATEGYHLTQLGPQLAVMAVWTIVIYAIAFRVFRWE